MKYKAAMSKQNITNKLMAEIQTRDVFFSIAFHEVTSPRWFENAGRNGFP
jgi:hypothetical protein